MLGPAPTRRKELAAMGAVNDTYELRVIGHILSQQHIHTLHFRQSAAGVGAAELITQYSGAPLTAYRACFSIDDPCVEMLHAQMVCGSVPLEAAVEVNRSPFSAQAGSRVSNVDRSPTFMAGLVSIKTAFSGRSRRGRFFLGGLRDSDFLQNSMDAAWIALAQAYANALKAAFVTAVGANFYQVIHSRTLAAVPGTDCQSSSTLVTDYVVSTVPTTMRSRKLGHGG